MVPPLLPFPGQTQRGSQVQSPSLAGPRTPPHREEGRDCPLGGGPLSTVGEGMQGFLEEMGLGKKGVMQGGRWGGATAPDPGPSFGHLQKGWGPPASPDLICPHWVPGKVGLGPLLPQHGVGAHVPSSGCGLFTHWASVCSSLKWRQ